MTNKEIGTEGEGFFKIKGIVKRLRAPDGCPWDREQTPRSVCKYILEEAYELVEAVEDGDAEAVREELGDLFFILIFVAEMYEEKGCFGIKDAMDSVSVKMIRRHPHIFGDVKVKGTQDVIDNWQVIKAEESRQKGGTESALGGLPKVLPALQKAFRVGERASRIGFDWKGVEDIWKKIEEEETELKEAIGSGTHENIKDELGDLLFAVANMARLLEINPEEALSKTVDRFIRRFKTMEELARINGIKFSGLPQNEFDRLWEDAKRLVDPEKTGLR
ncbi:nucleoside triphosphate pyrophosphohydrolase [Dissulfurimicrobium hydrothermale]|uniref:nucleoside triphosphate pyrophosphohydrolase n=1 Tax=Dissulfurimicrobium hydrothermale TaxID=1750598 RepID=UPI001EDC84AA|nr:nucleoside triphosphate pyrophosphohydrolase [Dissulfurimicrobium hydrothermale]UKL13765.1 nucleoside triphosphate pyrophosphohydrolase [Dissulfurimicrobium hydrothermale]